MLECFCSSSVVPGPGSPSQHWGGNGAEEQNPHPVGEIICSLCPFLEKKKFKKSFLQQSLLLVTPFVERSLAGAAGKKAKRVFKRQLEKREGGGRKKPESPKKIQRQGGSTKAGTHSPLHCLEGGEIPSLELSNPCWSHVLRDRAGALRGPPAPGHTQGLGIINLQY